MNKILTLLILLLASSSANADFFDFFKSKPAEPVPFKSTQEIMKRINSIIKTAEHCSSARVHYFSTGRDMRGGEAACDDYYDWEKNFFPRYKITPSVYKNAEIISKLRYIQDLEKAD